jgi:hypothetical protein
VAAGYCSGGEKEFVRVSAAEPISPVQTARRHPEGLPHNSAAGWMVLAALEIGKRRVGSLEVLAAESRIGLLRKRAAGACRE